MAVDHTAAGWACSGASRLREQSDVESPATVRGASSVGHETQVALCRVVWHRRARAASACGAWQKRVASTRRRARYTCFFDRQNHVSTAVRMVCGGQRASAKGGGGCSGRRPNLKQVTHKSAFFARAKKTPPAPARGLGRFLAPCYHYAAQKTGRCIFHFF